MNEERQGPLWQHPDVRTASETRHNPYHVLRYAINLPRLRHKEQAGREVREIISMFIDDARAGLPDEVEVRGTGFIVDVIGHSLLRVEGQDRIEASDTDWYEFGNEVLTNLVSQVLRSGINYGF